MLLLTALISPLLFCLVVQNYERDESINKTKSKKNINRPRKSYNSIQALYSEKFFPLNSWECNSQKALIKLSWLISLDLQSWSKYIENFPYFLVFRNLKTGEKVEIGLPVKCMSLFIGPFLNLKKVKILPFKSNFEHFQFEISWEFSFFLKYYDHGCIGRVGEQP